MLAYGSLYNLILSIKQDVGRIGNKIARGVAQVAYSELQEAHREIMNDYYDGYTPVSSYTYYAYKNNRLYTGRTHGYRRTGNLRRSLNPLGIVQSGHSFIATVQVGSSNMQDYINSTGHIFPANAVFDLIWNNGIRGLPPGNRGHIGNVSINTSPAGIAISGIPDSAMGDFVDQWIYLRAPDVADIIAHGL